MKIAFTAIAIFILALALPRPISAVVISTDSLPPAQQVEETRKELAAVGCVERAIDPEFNLVDAPLGMPYRAAARDRLENTFFFCPTATVSSLNVAQGQVLAEVNSWALDEDDIDDLVEDSFWSLKDEVVEGVAWITALMSGAGEWLFRMALNLVIWALSASTFITNPMVRLGWPLVQGIANVGFMVALLFIALATTLNLDIGGGWKKLLPRLLIAALLINFSLVIAGLILDFTKLLMAVATQIFIGTNSDGISGVLYDNSGLFKIVANLKNEGIARVNVLVDAIIKMIIIWSLAMATLALGIGLLVRYVVLIVLLILSPMAYLAFAVPGASNMAQKWWSNFFKYAFYGPAALFFIGLASRIADLGLGSNGNDIELALNSVVLVVIMVAAAVMSKKMGGTASVAILNAGQKGVKRAGRYARKNPAKTAAVAAGAASGGLLPAAAAGLGVAGGRKFGRFAAKSTKDYAGGVVKAGQQRVFGKKSPGQHGLERGQKVIGKVAPTGKQREARRDGRSYSPASLSGPAQAGTFNGMPKANLDKPDFVQNLDRAGVHSAISNEDVNTDVRTALVADKVIVKDMKTPEIEALLKLDTKTDRVTKIGDRDPTTGAIVTTAQAKLNKEDNDRGKANKEVINQYKQTQKAIAADEEK